MEINHQKITLESLVTGIPVIPEESMPFYKLNCMVCMHENSHFSGVKLKVDHNKKQVIFEVCWEGGITEKHLKSLRDEKKYVDFGAVAIALLLIRELTDYTAIEQSATGTTIDYYLGYKTEDETLIFNNHVAYLEVSGILKENDGNTIGRRLRNKEKRLNTPEDLPTIIAIVEFSKPVARLEEV